MKTKKSADFSKRFKKAASLSRTKAGFAKLLERRGRNIGLRGTSIVFTPTEIKQLGRAIELRRKIAQSDVPDNMLSLFKIGQSDVPDNMLSLLTALQAAGR